MRRAFSVNSIATAQLEKFRTFPGLLLQKLPVTTGTPHTHIRAALQIPPAHSTLPLIQVSVHYFQSAPDPPDQRQHKPKEYGFERWEIFNLERVSLLDHINYYLSVY